MQTNNRKSLTDIVKDIRSKVLLFIRRLPISDTAYTRLMYALRMKKVLHLHPPKNYNEKIHWMNLFGNIEQYSSLADKFAVRDFVSERIGKKYLKKLYQVCESADSIDFDQLPNKFVLKGTHGSGYIFICRDKSKINKDAIKAKARNWLSENYYYTERERIYKNIPPRIIAEEYIEQEGGLIDYKLKCFNGKVHFINIMVDYEDQSRMCDGDHFDRNWNLCPFISGKKCPQKLPKPKNLDEMIEIAEKLSRGIPFVRVDLYNLSSRILFGEMTFTPAAGNNPFEPKEWERKMGDLIVLPSTREQSSSTNQ